MKKLLLSLFIPICLFAMEKDTVKVPGAQPLRPSSFMEAILQINKNLPVRLLQAREISETEFNKLPPELLVMIGKQCLDAPSLNHAIVYIVDTVHSQLMQQMGQFHNKLDAVLNFIDSYPKPLSAAIKNAFVLKYRWKYKKSLSRTSICLWQNPNQVLGQAAITFDNQRVKAEQNGAITVTDLKTNKEIFRTRMNFPNPHLLLHTNQTRLFIKDPTNAVTQVVWNLPNRLDTIITGQDASQGQTGSTNKKRRRRCIIQGNRIAYLNNENKDEKDAGQNTKKQRK